MISHRARFLLTCLTVFSAASPLPLRAESDLFILEARDPVGDQEDICPGDFHSSGGDLKGARLVLKRVPIDRSSETADSQPAHVYIPVELTLMLDRELTGGEVQLCIFIHLPPIDIEHIITRDSILRGEPPGEERVVLATQSEISLFTGMEKLWDEEVTAFKNSPAYQNCRFEGAPDQRAATIREGKKYAIHHDGSYRFPPSPTFYWREIPPLKVSTSLIVRDLDGLTARGFRGLINDTMEAAWVELTETRERYGNF